MMKRIPLVEVPITEAEAEEQAMKNLQALAMDGSADDPRYAFMAALRLNIPARAKMNRLKEAADKLNKRVLPYSACRSGCSHCCNIAAVITQTEAEALAKASGLKMVKTKRDVPTVEMRMKWFKVPCPFLVKGQCSVYNDRPLACRLLFNMSDSPHFCNTNIPPEESHVIMLNLKELEDGYLKAFLNENWGDIRDFFPPAR
jgi:Fe-S-cluster containining protein